MKTGKREIRVGLAGCGHLARSVHLKVLRDLPAVRVVAIAEPDDDLRAAANAEAPGAQAFRDYPELLALPDIDAVVLSLPTGLHASAAMAAFEAGKHVYLEKPLATCMGDARAVLAAWRDSGRVGMIGFNYRFNRLYREAKRTLDSGRLGKPVVVRSVFSSAGGRVPDWKQHRESGGGVLLDLGSHHVDLVRYLLHDSIEDVACALRSIRFEEDTASLQLGLGDGALMQSLFSHSTVDEDRFEVYCKRGKIRVDRGAGLAAAVSGPRSSSHRFDQVRHAWKSVWRAGYAVEKFRAFGHEPSWRHAIEHFAGSVRGEHPASPNLEDGFRSLEVMLAAEESARSGSTIRIEAVP